MVESTREHPGLFQRLWRSRGAERVKTARYPLNAYGKLPIYKDFISTGLTDSASREFRNWLDRGFSHRWSVEENYRSTEIQSHSFLLRLPDGKGCVAGSLWGSSDEGGLRKFPFTLFFSFPSGQSASDPLTAVEYLAVLELRCEELRRRFGPGGSLASLYQTYRGAEFECPLKTREQIVRQAKSADSQVTLSQFAESLLGASAASGWPGLLADVAEAIEPSSEGVGAIRLPLGAILPRARELEFWLLWIARQDKKRKRPVCGLLYPNGSGPGRAVLFFRDLRADDIFLLHPARAEYSDVRELPRVTAPASPAEPALAVASPADPLAGSSAVAQAEGGAAGPTRDPPARAVAAAELVGTAAASEVSAVLDAEALPRSVEAVEAEQSGVLPSELPQPPSELLEQPAETTQEASVDTAPFLEAETLADYEALGPPEEAEEPLLDLHGRLRLTQPPFEMGPGQPSTVAAIEAPESPSLSADPPTPVATQLQESSPPVSLETLAPVPALDAQAPPPVLGGAVEAPPASSEAPTEASPVPSGWDRPLFALLE